MADPTIDSSFVAKFIEYIMGALLALCGLIYKINDKKLAAIEKTVEHEVRCARLEMKSKADNAEIKAVLARIDKSNEHIEKLYQAAEIDRGKMRDFHDHAMTTINSHHADVLKAMTKCGIRPQ